MSPYAAPLPLIWGTGGTDTYPLPGNCVSSLGARLGRGKQAQLVPRAASFGCSLRKYMNGQERGRNRSMWSFLIDNGKSRLLYWQGTHQINAAIPALVKCL